MKTLTRWLVRILGGIVVLLVVALGVIYVLSERAMGAKYPFHEVALAPPTDSASLARGEHLARLSCYGCHGDSLRGRVMFDVPGVARLVAPNAMEKLANYTDAEFAGFMRYGVRKDGSSVFVMPPGGFWHMSDADLSALIAYVRRQPTAATPTLPARSFRPLGRMGVAMGQFPNAFQERDTTGERIGADPAYLTTRQGEYFARMICTGCHGSRLTGDPQTPSPSIALAAGYSLPQLTTLLRTGTPRDPATKLTLMAEVAKSDLHLLTDAEIAAVHGYLASLPLSGVAGIKGK